jgi:Fe2+ or Zn2+ uptake regulation protein
MRRRSSQRERILDHVLRAGGHPTARDVLASVKREIPTLGPGNLYRNLKILVEEGRLRLLLLDDGVERYDAVTAAHYHIRCPSCGRLSDFDIPVQTHVLKEAQRHTKTRLMSHTIQFTGLCADCAEGASRQKPPRRKRT